MHEGVPPGGALVPELLARANAAVENASGEAAIELFGGMTLVARGAPLDLGLEDGARVRLADGERLEVPASRALRVRYVAVRGALDVPVALGGRGTLLVAGLGGWQGRPLRAGDRLPVGGAAAARGSARPFPLAPEEPIRVLAGPDAPRFDASAIEVLQSQPFTVMPASDRVGTRLAGPLLVRRDSDDARSAPLARGAIEVPSSGAPIVLGPDHPTTGGYPVLATVLRADCGRLAATPIGASVRFRLVALDELRERVLL